MAALATIGLAEAMDGLHVEADRGEDDEDDEDDEEVDDRGSDDRDAEDEENEDEEEASGAGGAPASSHSHPRKEQGPRYARAVKAGFKGVKSDWKKLTVADKKAFIVEHEPAKVAGAKGRTPNPPPAAWLMEADSNTVSSWQAMGAKDRSAAGRRLKRSRSGGTGGNGGSGSAAGGGGSGSAAPAGGGASIDLGDNLGAEPRPAKRMRGKAKPVAPPSTEAQQRAATAKAEHDVVLALHKYAIATHGRGSLFCVMQNDVAAPTLDGPPGGVTDQHDDAVVPPHRTTMRISTLGSGAVLDTISMMNGGTAPSELGAYSAFRSTSDALAHQEAKVKARARSQVSEGPAEAAAGVTRATTPPTSPAPAIAAAGGA